MADGLEMAAAFRGGRGNLGDSGLLPAGALAEPGGGLEHPVGADAFADSDFIFGGGAADGVFPASDGGANYILVAGLLIIIVRGSIKAREDLKDKEQKQNEE